MPDFKEYPKNKLSIYIADPRVENWFLMPRWTPILTIIIIYYLVVLIGPILMENRRPYTLRNVLKIYNFVQVMISGYMFKEFVISAWQSSYSLQCQPVDRSNSPQAVRMAAACWWFFFSKVIDLLDTVFFILRKKNSQVTFLHVYHHGSMILNWWLAGKYFPGGQIFFQCTCNSFVHVVMYTYYFLSAFGPAVQKYLWWKRYLTQLQLIQFLAIIVHLIYGMSRTCDFPFVLNCYIIIYCITLISLFTNFYIEAYQHQRTDRLEIQAAIQEKRARSIAAGGTGTNNYANNSYMNNLRNGFIKNSSENGCSGPTMISNGYGTDVNGNGPMAYLRR
ncbi:Elongation of very long chain fatty acids protein 4 [Orchesella cincta]|uniref:Elongation of very long chain fatty acids protein n=1 Tax=Orchesella cincta TaxID=48709 RepID=A0A1D2MFH1_ORCCI|nr:Elongation of very long chain fatty acids protein 4 [Orchesella cincta]